MIKFSSLGPSQPRRRGNVAYVMLICKMGNLKDFARRSCLKDSFPHSPGPGKGCPPVKIDSLRKAYSPFPDISAATRLFAAREKLQPDPMHEGMERPWARKGEGEKQKRNWKEFTIISGFFRFRKQQNSFRLPWQVLNVCYWKSTNSISRLFSNTLNSTGRRHGRERLIIKTSLFVCRDKLTK